MTRSPFESLLFDEVTISQVRHITVAISRGHNMTRLPNHKVAISEVAISRGRHITWLSVRLCSWQVS